MRLTEDSESAANFGYSLEVDQLEFAASAENFERRAMGQFLLDGGGSPVRF